MRRILDISLDVHPHMPVWPTSRPVRLARTKCFSNGDDVTVSELRCDVHTGTHVDAPLHFLPGGATVLDMDLQILVGPAMVRYTPCERVTPSILDALTIPPGTKRLLLRTRNSEHRGDQSNIFRRDYVALTPEGAQWVVGHGIRLIGIDGPSIQEFADSCPTTHRVLLSDGVIILEGLDLSAAADGEYELVCLPLRLVGAEGAPARAVLMTPA